MKILLSHFLSTYRDVLMIFILGVVVLLFFSCSPSEEYEFQNLTIENVISIKQDDNVSVDVHNTNNMDGEQVVQVYLIPVPRKNDSPLKPIGGLRRISLKAKETTILDFVINAEQLAQRNKDGNSIHTNGDMKINIAGKQPDLERNDKTNSSGIIRKTMQLN